MGAQRLIVCAANKVSWVRDDSDGEVIVCGVRHWDPLMRNAINHLDVKNDTTVIIQGFVDNRGVFLTREEAFIVAMEAGQIRHKSGDVSSEKLFSEDIW